MVRLIASLGEYIYAQGDDGIYVNLFAGSTARLSGLTIRQQTRYPWDGAVRIAVDPVEPHRFSVFVRIPGWTNRQVMAGDLYRFQDAIGGRVAIRVNGRTVNPPLVRGYARIEREWKAGDLIELTLPMETRRVVADSRVKEDEGRVALERGPLVYCAEWADNGGHALNIIVPDNARLRSEFRPNLLRGVEVITGNVQAVKGGRTLPHEMVAIPYFAWANRGMGEMQVWLPRSVEKARLVPAPLPGALARVLSSGGIEKKWTGYNDQNDDLSAVYDGADPLNSADESNLYFPYASRCRAPGVGGVRFQAAAANLVV
ncbi:hypothetical protein SBA4_1320005 [Candidatus Sulfopaludibacter sp. SbA4]|nr:hypothetical protein SBA4_1320005 [Candidatus Sulfopaludibacter sp. SbA4]